MQDQCPAPQKGKCKFCGARILWFTTQNDKRIALDPEPVRLPPDSHYVIGKGNVACQIADCLAYTVHASHCETQRREYVRHFEEVTCDTVK